jgi:hypothetical protein
MHKSLTHSTRLHQKILETWEDDIEGPRNADIINKEISTCLCEAHDEFEKLQASTSNVHFLKAVAMSDSS